jgi:hypothetical protein
MTAQDVENPVLSRQRVVRVGHGKDMRFRFDQTLRRRPEDHPNQAQLTPAYVLEPVRRLLGSIELDPCTEPDNPVGAQRFYCLPQDGAALPWDASTIFVNPPYGQVRDRWVKRCVGAARIGSRVVLLIPSASDTRTFQYALGHCTTAQFVAGRLKFALARDNGRRQAASHPSVLFGYNVDLSAITLGVTVRRAFLSPPSESGEQRT